jgi:type IV secretion system protein VirB4
MLKAVIDELGFGRAAAKERPISGHIPYLRHVSDRIVGLANGAFISIIKLDGLFFQTEDQAELNMRSAVQNTMIRSLGSSRYAMWSTVIRREIEARLDGRFDDDFCETLNTRYMEQLRLKRMFKNEIYLTIVRSKARGVLRASDAIKHVFTSSRAAAKRKDRQAEVVEFE